ncbi:MAG: ABC transporter substrate-binding protein [Acetobacteraceae bacterium]|nr:ABC transporter substrate-binding protein [Pseudomonadota bacterium]
MNSLVFQRRGILLAGIGAVASGVLPAYAQADAAVTPIQRLVDGLLVVMKEGTKTPFQQRYGQLAPVIDSVFNLPQILRESVGPTWESLPPDQQSMLEDAFQRYTVSSYVNSFDAFNGQQFVVHPDTRTVGKDRVVRTEIIPRTGDKHVLDYVMRDGGSGWKVVDVLADGSVSRVAVQRSDFRRLLARGGAAGLAESLRTKSASLSG